MTIPGTLGSALNASIEGITKARRSVDEAASSIASFGKTAVVPTDGSAKDSALAEDIVQISQASTSIKANAAVARIVGQAMSEAVGLGAKIDRKA